jgi:triacylglycerol lipase
MNGATVQAPIILIHGILGFGEARLLQLKLDYFRGIPEVLSELGNNVPKPPSLPPTGGVAERAAVLANYIDSSAVPPGPVHLIAHSMGGLDAVHLIARLKTGDRVLSLTTLGTPFQGTPVADLGDGIFAPLLESLRLAGLDVHGFLDLMRANAAEFLAEGIGAKDIKSIPCFCVAGNYEPVLPGVGLLAATHDVIKKLEGDNDGLVSVASATKFGQQLATWPADHFRLINWPTDLIAPFDEFTDRTIIDGYIGLVQNLVEKGF